MKKIAVMLFGERVAPRFDCAQSFLLVNVENRCILESREFRTAHAGPAERVGKLNELQVDAVICGGIDEASARRLHHHGINAYPWVTGMACDALISFVNGDLEAGVMVGPGGQRKGRWKIKEQEGFRWGERRGRPGFGRGQGRGGRGS